MLDRLIGQFPNTLHTPSCAPVAATWQAVMLNYGELIKAI